MPSASRFAFRTALTVAGLAALLTVAAPPTQAEGLIVFAAASLKNALDEVNAACAVELGGKATISYAASSALAKQIEAGAPADVFFSADLDWMKYLSEKKLIRQDTETKLLGNHIVLIAPADSDAAVNIAPGIDVAKLLGDGRLAMANVEAVPAGKYGKAALESLGVWSSVKAKVAQAENVRAALAFVSTGEAPLGIVYKTDAQADEQVKIIGAFPDDTHPPIVYPVAQTTASGDERTPAFLKCLKSGKAKELFEAQGFTVLTPVVTN